MRRFSRPRHATVVAYLALFSGLGGTAFAAATITGADIVDSTIESVDVKNRSLAGGDLAIGAVGNFELAPNSITANKVFDNALTGADIKDGTISAADLKLGTLGMAPIKRVDAYSAEDSTAHKKVEAKCPSGWRVIGGGAGVGDEDTELPTVGLKMSLPHDFSYGPHISGWYATGSEHSPTSATWLVFAHALCVQMES